MDGHHWSLIPATTTKAAVTRIENNENSKGTHATVDLPNSKKYTLAHTHICKYACMHASMHVLYNY